MEDNSCQWRLSWVRNIRVRYKLYSFLKSCIEEGRQSYLKYDQLMVDGQEYTYDYDNARP